MEKQMKAVWAILVMLTFWVTIQTVKINTVVPDFNEINQTLNILLDRVNGVESYINDLKSKAAEMEYKELYKEQIKSLTPFDETFKEYREDFGPGAIFTWQGEPYTTYYKEELTNNQ
jgi:hypothetical protein